MGIDIHALNFVRHASARQPLGKTLTIGRQEVHVPEHELRRILDAKPEHRKDKYCERLVETYLGATCVESLDNSDYEGATFVHDMNRPLPEDMHGRFDTVIDGGSLEHVFNAPQALKNCSALCKPGGQILHILPANNFCGHGFWQFSPELFFSLYSEANGYAETEVIVADLANKRRWYKVTPPSEGRRANITSSTPLYALVRTVRGSTDFSHEIVQQSDYIYAWEQGDAYTAHPEAMLPGLRKRLKEIPFAYQLLFPAYERLLKPKVETRLNSKNPNLTIIDLS